MSWGSHHPARPPANGGHLCSLHTRQLHEAKPHPKMGVAEYRPHGHDPAEECQGKVPAKKAGPVNLMTPMKMQLHEAKPNPKMGVAEDKPHGHDPTEECQGEVPAKKAGPLKPMTPTKMTPAPSDHLRGC